MSDAEILTGPIVPIYLRHASCWKDLNSSCAAVIIYLFSRNIQEDTEHDRDLLRGDGRLKGRY